LRYIFFLLLSVAICSNIFAQSNGGNLGKSGVNIWTNIFGDYFYKSGGDSTNNNLQYSKYKKNFNAFAFRRINVGFDYEINKIFNTRFAVSFDGTDTLPNGNTGVYVRDAWVNWKEIFTNSNLIVGIIPTPGFSYFTDPWWGYRSVEKTIMDQRGIISSRDLGVMLYGSFDNEKQFGYYTMIGNGSGSKVENNKYKKLYGLLDCSFLNGNMAFDLYSDYEPSANNRSKTTMSAFGAYKNDAVSLGVESFFQIQNNYNTSTTAQSPDIVPFGISFYLTKINIYEDLKFFFRYDFYNEDINNSRTGFYQSFVETGFDFTPSSNVHFIPNIWLNAFTPKPDQIPKYTTDVVPRITFWYTYK
jgi:hypothetical protein